MPSQAMSNTEYYACVAYAQPTTIFIYSRVKKKRFPTCSQVMHGILSKQYNT